MFPSLHEGFGLPALEAMSCGAPTIGSGTTSIPEVIGREDALFDPTEPASIARSMQNVLTDTAFADSLRAHAPRQAAKFSWDNSAKAALQAMEAVASRRAPRDRRWVAASPALDAGYRTLVQAVGGLDVGCEPEPFELQQAAALISSGMAANEALARGGELPASLSWRVEGPFDSSYSLALVNRCLAEALALSLIHI